MVRWLAILVRTLGSTIRTQRELALENLALRQQVAVWKVRQPRPQLTATDRLFWVVLSRLWKNWRSSAGGAARDSGAVAPSGLQALLGMEESTPTGSARDWDGSAGSHSADEPRQSSLGCTPNPRRGAEAGPDGLAGDGFEVHAPAAEAAVTGVAPVSEEPRPGSDRVGFLHGPDRDLSSAVCAGGVEPRAAPAATFQYHGASDRRVDGAAADRGVRAGGQPSVSDPGSGPGLWRTIFASSQDVGHPGDGHSATLAVAKRLCRARDWLDSTRMSGPYRGNR